MIPRMPSILLSVVLLGCSPALVFPFAVGDRHEEEEGDSHVSDDASVVIADNPSTPDTTFLGSDVPSTDSNVSDTSTGTSDVVDGGSTIVDVGSIPEDVGVDAGLLVDAGVDVGTISATDVVVAPDVIAVPDVPSAVDRGAPEAGTSIPAGRCAVNSDCERGRCCMHIIEGQLGLCGCSVLGGFCIPPGAACSG